MTADAPLTVGGGGEPTISLRRVSKWYGPVIGVNEVSLEIGPGITGLLGPNGAGKSTLMRLVTGQLRPSLGEVRVLGAAVWRSARVRRFLGFSPEVDAFYEEMTAMQFVRTMGRLAGLSRRDALRQAGAALERTGMAENASKTLRACSRGMRQRVKIAQALVHEPRILVLDEPLSGIDPSGRIDFISLFRSLREEGKTIVISTHILHEIEGLGDGIVLMARGRILAAGTLARIRELLAEYPLTVRITADGCRSLAGALLDRESVVGVTVGGPSGSGPSAGGPRAGALSARGASTCSPSARDPTVRGEAGDLVVKVLRPVDFFRELPGLALDLGVEITRIEALDASAEAVFQYLVGGYFSGDAV